jgi:hypothetical protein
MRTHPCPPCDPLAHHLALTYLYAAALENFVRGLLSIVRGGYRPDWYSVCQPDLSTPIGAQPVCTSTEDLANGRRSFPCGHCSFACAGGLVYTLHILALSDAHDARGHIWKNGLALLPSLGAWLVSITRITGLCLGPPSVAPGLPLPFPCLLLRPLHTPLLSRRSPSRLRRHHRHPAWNNRRCANVR